MRRRLVKVKQRKLGNYIKKYPHVYERFQKQITIGSSARAIAGILIGLIFIGALLFLAAGSRKNAIFLIILSTALAFFTCMLSAGEKIGEEELLLMEKDFAGRTKVYEGLGYRTEEALIVGCRRIPIAGLSYVSYDREFLGRYGSLLIGMNFVYEDGTRRQAEIFKMAEESDDRRLRDFIGSCGGDIKIYNEK